MFGFLGALGRMLPGYMQGERMAVQDNWNDLNQYNKVQAGQIQNAFDEAAFNPRLSSLMNAAEQTDYQTDMARMTRDTSAAMFPGNVAYGWTWSQWAPEVAGQEMALRMQLMRQAATNPYGMLAGASMFPMLGWLPNTGGLPSIDNTAPSTQR